MKVLRSVRSLSVRSRLGPLNDHSAGKSKNCLINIGKIMIITTITMTITTTKIMKKRDWILTNPIIIYKIELLTYA